MQDKDESAAAVHLPGGNYVLFNWKARNRSSVQKGETIAYACILDSGAPKELPTPVATPGHKRPMKRKRGVELSVSSRSAPKEFVSADTGNANICSSSSSSPMQSASVTENRVNETEDLHRSSTIASLVPIVAPIGGMLQISKATITTDPTCIGFIEPCNHPAIMDGLCAVCGRPVATDKSSRLASVDSDKRSQRQVTVSGGVTVVVSEEEAQDMARQSCNKLREQQKLSLVLDLDHTLVHATADPRAQAYADQYEDVRTLLFPIEIGPTPNTASKSMVIQHFLKLRPHVKEFLQRAKPLYELSIYTAGTRAYAEEVITVLCRHVVGATVDQVEFNQLRHRLWFATHELAKQLQSQKTNNSKKGNTNEGTETPNQPIPENTKVKPEPNAENGLDTDERALLQTKKKDSPTQNVKNERKQVSFGALPSKDKVDAVTQEHVDELTKQLKDAEEMEAKAVEFRQSLFGSRIVSRTDVSDLGRDTKSIKRIFPCGGTMAVILDDREDVWAKDKELSNKGEPPPNLLLVRPYHWKPFLGFADVNNSSGKYDFVQDENTDAKKEEEETDVQLLWSADILDRLHTRFYGAQGEQTVPSVLNEMRGEVLAGKRLVLSGLVPLHKQKRLQNGSHPRPTIVRYAETLGAQVMDNVGAETTHVVAARDGTDKIIMARKIPGCHIVKALWLTECLWSLTLRNVSSHLLGPPSSSKAVAVAPTPSSKTTQFSSDDSSDDDDFAAELESEMLES